MAKKGLLGQTLSFVMWLTGVIVALAVGFSLLPEGALSGGIPLLPVYITTIAGWIVVIATLLGVVLAIIDSVI